MLLFVVLGLNQFTRRSATAGSMWLSSFSTPLTELSAAYGVSFFKVPVALGAMVSFFSLSLSCLNAGARIIYPHAMTVRRIQRCCVRRWLLR